MSFHYTYISTDGIRYYIGVRSCKCQPYLDDKYFGSFTDETFEPNKKFILRVFSTRKAAVNHERWLLKSNDVLKNDRFVNRSIQNETGFITRNYGQPSWNQGKSMSQETKEKLSKSRQGIEPWNKGKTGIYSDETLQKMSESAKNREMNEETCKKISITLTGRTFSEEHKSKISKGVTGKNNANYDQTIYHFHHEKYGDFFCTRNELQIKFNLDKSCLYRIIKGKKFSHKGWRVLCLLCS